MVYKAEMWSSAKYRIISTIFWFLPEGWWMPLLWRLSNWILIKWLSRWGVQHGQPDLWKFQNVDWKWDFLTSKSLAPTRCPRLLAIPRTFQEWGRKDFPQLQSWNPEPGTTWSSVPEESFYSGIVGNLGVDIKGAVFLKKRTWLNAH